MAPPPLTPYGVQAAALDLPSALLYAAIVGMVVYLVQLRPWWAVCAIVASTPFAAYRAVGPVLLTLPKAILIASAFGLLVSRGETRRWNRPSFLLLAGALAIVAAEALSIRRAPLQTDALRETITMVGYALTFAVVAIAMRRRPFELPVRITLVVTSTLVSLPALGALAVGAQVAGPLESPDALCGYLGILVPVQVAFLLLRRTSLVERLAVIPAIAAIVLTFNESGWIACLAALAVLFAVTPAARRRTTLAVVCAGIGVGVLTAALVSLVARAQLPGASPPADLTLSDARANSLFARSLAEGGFALFFAWMYTFSAAIWSFARGPLREPFVAGALAATIGFALNQTFGDLAPYPKVGILFWALLALGAARYDHPQYD